MIERHHIGRPADLISQNLKNAYNQFCVANLSLISFNLIFCEENFSLSTQHCLLPIFWLFYNCF